ncbi:DUF58 domain-containing protein [Fulvivirga sediminis]|uniref:DUF58 domain-containing protein n=1 Tax=Fulvivirga sediminis TaxID=2803949 RepID=A0A937F6H1_9BACT|nr:DUF58 domain-containing protein [Fulvivirga sediminis]MBL3657317.1 DUF58 domain-containing protein [Fulvivirga sediminis]
MKGNQDYTSLLKPEVISSVKGLSLIAKLLVDSYLSGLNSSKRKGSGIEFSQYRGYEPGDDLRMLDWKRLARSGKYFIKESERETHTVIKFIIDASASMLHTEQELSKLVYAQILAASIAYLAQNQGDNIGLFALNDTKVYSLLPSNKPQQFNRFIQSMLSIEAGGKWPKEVNTNIIHSRKERELIVFLSDLYEKDNEISDLISQLKTVRNEVVVFHLLGEKELLFDYSGTIVFEDLESGKQVKATASNIKEKYLTALNNKITQCKHKMLHQGISYESFIMGRPMETALSNYLKRRARLV